MTTIANPHDTRLGFRINEWTSLTGTSRPTIWRQIKDGRLKVVNINGIKLIPRSEAVRLGLLDAPDGHREPRR